jgi:hypothetical protein
MGRDLKNRSTIAQPAGIGRPIEMTVSAHNQAADRRGAVRASGKIINVGKKAAVGGYGKDSAVIAGAAVGGCPVKITVAPLYEPRRRVGTIGPIKRKQRGKRESAMKAGSGQTHGWNDDEEEGLLKVSHKTNRWFYGTNSG